MRIMGVDFSGAGSDESVGKTWLAQGWLDDHALALENPRSISRADLTAELKSLKEQAVVAMDFPFSVPMEFARHWEYDIAARRGAVVFETMPNLWAASAITEWGIFQEIVRNFGERCRDPGERIWPVRAGDKAIPEAQSPLKPKGNPTMLPMTFRGMQMLHTFRNGLATGAIWVPPRMEPPGYIITLLEVMPGATLRSFGLPHTGYKNTSGLTQEQAGQRREVRQRILDELPQRINPLTVNLPEGVSEICLGNDDALDSVVAAITAALWEIDRVRFITPQAQTQPNYCRIQLEGWLYIPRRRCPNCGVIL